ncbi:MAG: inositol monophosphatase family protein [Pseudanabaenaceae cyanobacterium bins.68]|nr:inositol monophosphatase family protein [Pseudanabaenaceae cyanobacterium bins.68]
MTPELNQQICQFIRQLGQQAKQLRTQGLKVTAKGVNDYVTDVDCLLDQQFSQQFQQWFPQDGVISEENAASLGLWQQQLPRYWLIDPIDGTSDFIEGGDSYSVMVGLLDQGQPVMGWVYAPEGDRLYFGGTLLGNLYVQIGEQPPQVLDFQAPITSLGKVILSDKDQAKFGDLIQLVIPGAEYYSVGSFGLKVIEVIMAKADAYLYLNRRVKLWDTVAPLAFAKLAGLLYWDLDGTTLGFEPSLIQPQTLAHLQDVIIGWPGFVQTVQPAIATQLRPLLPSQII